MPREELEDCYSLATLELLARVRRGGDFHSRAHIAHALEQRLISRVHDRRRAISGRSPIEAAMAEALPLATGDAEARGVEPQDVRADVERLVLQRELLRQVTGALADLTPDQRLVLRAQLEQIGCAQFCDRHGWSAEKYRKVAQRARARLAHLVE